MILLAGDTVLATRDVAPEPEGSRGTFLDYSTTYEYNASDASLAGEDLTIRFLEIDNPDNPQPEVDIDNVRLSSIPEPTSALLLALGATLLASTRRRRAA